jgi:hypothetical protein
LRNCLYVVDIKKYVVDIKKYVKIVCSVLGAQLEDSKVVKGVIFNKEHLRWL